MSKYLANLLPLPSRIIREVDPSSALRFVRTGSEHPRAKATWAHYFRRRSSRLVLTLDMSAQATESRNEIKSQHLHPWGYFPDTRFVMIDPLPDREVYLPMYKDVLDNFCASLPPTMPIGPTNNVYVCKERIPSALAEEVTPNEVGRFKAPVTRPNRNHHMIALSLPQDSIVHKLRDYFLTEFNKFESEEMQNYIMEIRSMKFRAQLPLGFARNMGPRDALLGAQSIVSSLKGGGGVQLGNATGLSLLRHHHGPDMYRGWDEPLVVQKECLYSRAFEAAGTPEFISIAPNEESNEEANEEANEHVATESES
ncbi:hypothetical protein DSL72_002618 [Monilinia vaccinii-corymbosi]|uniref:Uncharacterized protein n=1 Tax=Monilinia vaccinii-corymbosi TaxID=61207 RepID=A0A8A3PD77_9HELO|nr:hypothetical protein DSL72_002618 [Monilinia vaccinii-corymbosi]